MVVSLCLMQQMNQLEKSKPNKIFNKLFSTVKWKASVDEAALFIDQGKLPCILVENKADLLEGDNVEHDPQLEEFAKSNEFDGTFRTSAKTGLNIDQSMEFLIKTIIKRMESFESKGNEAFSTERKNVTIDKEKHAQTTVQRKKKDGCC